MDATELRTELLRLLTTDPEVRAAVVAVVGQDVRTGRLGIAIQDRVTRLGGTWDGRPVPSWLAREGHGAEKGS